MAMVMASHKSKFSNFTGKKEKKRRRRRRSRRRMRHSFKVSSRDSVCCQQLQSMSSNSSNQCLQIPRINVFESNPYTLHNGNQKEEFKYINVYPPDRKSNPSRRNAFGRWRAIRTIAKVKDDQGKNIAAYKREYEFLDPQENRIGLKMREYTRHDHGENDYSYCIIYKTKQYVYLPKSEERGRSDMERPPNEEHRSSSAAPTPIPWPTSVQRRESTTPVVSQNSNLGPPTLSASDEKIIHDLERLLFTEDSGADPISSSNIQRYSSILNEMENVI